MDRNLWLAVALSGGVYLVWYGYFDKKVNPPPPPAAVSRAAAPAASGGAPAAAPANAPAEPAEPAVAPEQDAKAALAQSETIKLGDADALVNPRGAALAGYSFQGPISRVELVVDPAHGLFSTFPDLTFKRDRSAKSGFVYTATRPDGVRVTKEFVPGQGTVLPRIVVTATNPARRPVEIAPWTLTVGPGLGTVETEKKDNAKLTRVIGLTIEAGGLNGKIDTMKPGVHPGPYRWVAVDNRYFLAALLPSFEHFEPASSSAPAELTLTAKSVMLAPGGSFTWEIPYYLGSKGYNWLARYGFGLERSVDLGWGFIAPIGRACLQSLVWLHGLIGNWGWAIIALTLILQAILAPLTYKSLKAAAMMRKVQPEIQRLQARYKDDPTKLNQEMMALYKKGGANPLGGCLPMLAQMPIFYGLYDALRSSWELHGASWIFWIKDLSTKDPYYVLPIVMGGLMFLQSKLNPPAGDPAQQQMMMFMPLIFTFMFLKFPAGLVLYWLTNSLVSTLIQLAMRDRLNAAA
ncbi:MAG TPA: membrane protein insertase YidC [Elusimicrobiota bacterium]|nr:membrane protein insertase YidC [Elusimicrobiota bacterium]